MALRELKSVYAGSLFGFAWAVANPLSQVLIYGVVFGMFFKLKPDPVYGTGSFFLFLLCGLIPWQFFAQTVSSATNSITSNSNLVKKSVGFHPEIFPVISVLSNLISHAIGLGIMLIILIAFHRVNPYMPLIILYLFPAAVFSIGLGWMLSGINVYLKDVRQVLDMVLMGWFFLTPLFYSPGIIPHKLLPIMKLNPMYHVVEGYRMALLAGSILPITDILYLFASAFIMFGTGGMIFRKLKPGFAEVL